MFTGLIEGNGTIVKLEPRGKDMRLSIEASFDLDDIKLGESITVDGACLTVVSWRKRTFTVDVSQETLSRTTLGQHRKGTKVNLERALRLGDRLGGHLVSGHVDCRARVIGRETRGESLVLQFELAIDQARYLIEKGSVAVNGMSLTVNRCDERSFEVNVIPHTAEATTVGSLRVGDEVNVEVDLIGKYVEKFVRSARGSRATTTTRVDRNLLEKHGFL
jgi:riboflavin synthase